MSLLFISSLQEGFGYGLLALGIYITFRILNTPDLTTDGSFGLGMAVSIVLTAAGHPVLSLAAALAAGASDFRLRRRARARGAARRRRWRKVRARSR